MVQVQENHDPHHHLRLLVPGQLGIVGRWSLPHSLVRDISRFAGGCLDTDILPKLGIRPRIVAPGPSLLEIREKADHARVHVSCKQEDELTHHTREAVLNRLLTTLLSSSLQALPAAHGRRVLAASWLHGLYIA